MRARKEGLSIDEVRMSSQSLPKGSKDPNNRVLGP